MEDVGELVGRRLAKKSKETSGTGGSGTSGNAAQDDYLILPLVVIILTALSLCACYVAYQRWRTKKAEAAARMQYEAEVAATRAQMDAQYAEKMQEKKDKLDQRAKDAAEKNKDAPDAFKKWAPKPAGLEQAWKTLTPRMQGDPDFRDVQAEWKRGGYEDKKRIIWNVNTFLVRRRRS